MNLYIYYDVAVADAPALAEAVRAMQATLGLAPSAMQLLRRMDTDGTTQTWMEIYENVPDDFEARLAASIDLHGLRCRIGARHVERFTTLFTAIA